MSTVRRKSILSVYVIACSVQIAVFFGRRGFLTKVRGSCVQVFLDEIFRSTTRNQGVREGVVGQFQRLHAYDVRLCRVGVDVRLSFSAFSSLSVQSLTEVCFHRVCTFLLYICYTRSILSSCLSFFRVGGTFNVELAAWSNERIFTET